MPHPIYGPPEHKLDVVTIKLTLPQRSTGYVTTVASSGSSTTKRADLWHQRETWTATEQRNGLEPSDWVHQLVLVALQDRPRTPTALEQGLLGAGWEDVPLPF